MLGSNVIYINEIPGQEGKALFNISGTGESVVLPLQEAISRGLEAFEMGSMSFVGPSRFSDIIQQSAQRVL